MHPLCVAYLVASWGFEADTICAALLHDTLEDTTATYDELVELFGKDIADMVDAVTAIDNEIKDKTGLTKEEIDELSDRRLKEKMSEKALFIKVADRVDNLKTIQPFKEEKKIAKAKHTREIIIPMLMKEGAYQLIDVLEDLCLQIEHPERYAEITSTYTTLRTNNAYTTSKTLKLFSEVFSPNNSIDSSEFHTVLGSIVEFTHNPRSAISVYRQINAQANNIAKDLPKLLCKKISPCMTLHWSSVTIIVQSQTLLRMHSSDCIQVFLLTRILLFLILVRPHIMTQSIIFFLTKWTTFTVFL